MSATTLDHHKTLSPPVRARLRQQRRAGDHGSTVRRSITLPSSRRYHTAGGFRASAGRRPGQAAPGAIRVFRHRRSACRRVLADVDGDVRSSRPSMLPPAADRHHPRCRGWRRAASTVIMISAMPLKIKVSAVVPGRRRHRRTRRRMRRRRQPLIITAPGQPAPPSRLGRRRCRARHRDGHRRPSTSTRSTLVVLIEAKTSRKKSPRRGWIIRAGAVRAVDQGVRGRRRHRGRPRHPGRSGLLHCATADAALAKSLPSPPRRSSPPSRRSTAPALGAAIEECCPRRSRSFIVTLPPSSTAPGRGRRCRTAVAASPPPAPADQAAAPAAEQPIVSIAAIQNIRPLRPRRRYRPSENRSAPMAIRATSAANRGY